MGKAKMRPRRDFGQLEAAAELNLQLQVGHPKPREAHSQQSQLRGRHPAGTRKDAKRGMARKLT